MNGYCYLIAGLLLSTVWSCQPGQVERVEEPSVVQTAAISSFYIVPEEVRIETYFDFMDSLVYRLDTIAPYPIDEHLIVRSNPWILDTLEHTDYYYQAARGQFVYDQTRMVVLNAGDTLHIPSPVQARHIRAQQEVTYLDLNIPEFVLKVIEGRDTLFSFRVRVGRNEKKYLAMIDREEDLRTKTGTGEIVRISRDPSYINPSNNKPYYTTLRDDGKRTKLPRIPWLEPELNGHRYGQLIHPTTNPVTLGKAYSNGCIGTSESDAWRIYYYAPVGTKIRIRYELGEENGQNQLRDIYNYGGGRQAMAYAGMVRPLFRDPSWCECICLPAQ